MIETSLDEMIDQARNFPKLAQNSPVQIIALTADYLGTVPLPSVPAPNSLTRIQQRNTLEELGREYLKLRDYKSNLQFILDHLVEFDDFRDMDAAQLTEKRQEYQASLVATAEEVDNIVARANSCATDYNQCQTFVPTIQYLPLPKIGGQLMTLKQIEEKLAALEQELGQLRGGSKAFRHILVSATPSGEVDPWSNMISIQSSKQEPPYVNWAHSPNGGTPIRYAYIRAGDFGNEKSFSLVADEGAKINLQSDEHVNVYAPYLYVSGEIRGKMGYTGSFWWEQGQPHVKMIHSSKGFAALTYIRGNFAGGGEYVYVYVAQDGYWYLGGDSKQQSVGGAAICIGDV